MMPKVVLVMLDEVQMLNFAGAHSKGNTFNSPLKNNHNFKFNCNTILKEFYKILYLSFIILLNVCSWVLSSYFSSRQISFYFRHENLFFFFHFSYG